MQITEAILTDIRERLLDVKNKKGRVTFLSNALLFCSGFFLLITGLFIAESIFEFSSAVRTIIAVFFLLSAAFIGSWMVALPLLKLFGIFESYEENESAKNIGAFFPSIQDRLINALQIAKSAAGTSSFYSIDLIDGSLKNFAEEIRPLDFAASVNTASLPKRGLGFLACAGIFLFFVLVFPGSFSGAAYRMIHFTKEFSPPPAYLFEIFPGNKEIVKGDNAEVRVKVISRSRVFSHSISELTILRRQEGQENYDETRLMPDSGNLYRTTFPALRTTTEYFARFSNVESEHYTFTVLDRPLIRSFRIKLDYPPYSKIPPKFQDDFIGDVTALAGTSITLTGTASKPLKEAVMRFGNGTLIPITFRDEKFSVSFKLTNDDSYRIFITDKEGLSNSEPVTYRLKNVKDESPIISIIEPGRNIDMAGGQSLALLLHAEDDYGFSSMRLGYRLVRSRFERAQDEYKFSPIPINAFSNGEIQLTHLWNLSGLDLVPEDVVEYFAEVFDNDMLKGPKSGRSNLYLLRLPSLEEVFADADKEHERSLDDLKQSLEEANKLKDDIEAISRELKKNKDPDWQMQKKAEEMAKRYQDVQKKLDDVQSRLEQMTEQAQQQNILSKETIEKYFELQQLFQQIDAADLQNMLKQTQQQMQNISKEQLRQEMQKITFSEEMFRQSIERTMNLLKRIQIEQKMDEVKKRAQELEAAEKNIREESKNASNDQKKLQDLAKQQAELAKKEQAMEHEADDLQRKMEEFFTEMPSDKLKKTIEQLKQQDLNQQMQNAGQQMQAGNTEQSQQTQQQIVQQLQQFNQQMDAMQQQMLQEQAQYVTNEMRKATNDILEISKDEEALKQQSRNAPQNSPQLRQNAQDQQRAIQDLNNVIKALNELSQKSFAVTPEMNKAITEAQTSMNNAMKNLDVRNGTTASKEQEQAMAALNRAAVQVQNALQAMMQGGSSGAGSLMQQLRMMAGQQMSINMQTQQMGEMMPQQAAQAARLAKEQSAMQKSLEELNREAQQSGSKQKLLGDLQKIADEMKEVAKNLEQNNVNTETIKKQERILSRLLDASKSMRERDYEKKRKAETGTQITRRSPKNIDLDLLEGNDKLREELLKALEQGYSKDYQELIRKYFEELEKTEKSVY